MRTPLLLLILPLLLACASNPFAKSKENLRRNGVESLLRPPRIRNVNRGVPRGYVRGGEGPSIFDPKRRIELCERVAAFLEEHLK